MDVQERVPMVDGPVCAASDQVAEDVVLRSLIRWEVEARGGGVGVDAQCAHARRVPVGLRKRVCVRLSLVPLVLRRATPWVWMRKILMVFVWTPGVISPYLVGHSTSEWKGRGGFPRWTDLLYLASGLAWPGV
ncbi:hypothetical protein ACFY1A_38750 [Streptomyces sp. NPDC001520]|uniref:hypothetical protein n=1 Tax=Streptomyces sp. NPDC001520 TaxID=3364581 RepID=UPI00367A89E3